MLTLTELLNYTLVVYPSPVCECEKPSLWLKNSCQMIKLASFVDAEREQLFIDYFEEKGIPIDTYAFEEGNKQ